MVDVTENPDRRVARTGAGAAALVAVAAALALGLGTGVVDAVVVAALGAGLVGVGAWAFAAADPRLAVGSVATAAGAVALGGGVVLGLGEAPLVTVAVAAALLVVVVDAGPGFSWSGTREINHSLKRSAGVTAVAFVLALLVHQGAFVAAAAVLADVWVVAVTASALGGLVALALQVTAVVLGFGALLPVLRRWAPVRARDRVAALSAYRITPTDVPPWVWAGLVGGALANRVAGVPEWFAGVLDLLAPVGPVLAAALSSVALHLLPTAVLCLFALAWLVESARRLVVAWLGGSPPRAVAHAGGGLVVSAGVLLTLAIPPVGGALATRTGVGADSALGVGAAALVVALVAMAALWVSLAAALLVSDTDLVPEDRAGFALGGAALFVATLAAGLTGAAAPLVFVGVAGAVLVVDLGGYAAALDATVAADSETRRAEVVHVAASLLVGGGAVCAALFAAYVLVPLAPRVRVGTGPEWAPLLALVLALFAAAAFLRLLAVGADGTGE